MLKRSSDQNVQILSYLKRDEVNDTKKSDNSFWVIEVRHLWLRILLNKNTLKKFFHAFVYHFVFLRAFSESFNWMIFHRKIDCSEREIMSTGTK